MKPNNYEHRTNGWTVQDVQDCVSLAVEKGSCEIHTKAPIIESLNKALKSGLRDTRSGYWHIVKLYTHSSEINTLNKFFNPTFTQQEKGITWLCYTLVEGTLLSYISSLLLDTKTLQTYYHEVALLRHHELTVKLTSVLSRLSSVVLSPITDRMADELVGDEGQTKKEIVENQLDFELRDPDAQNCDFVLPSTPLVKPDLCLPSIVHNNDNQNQQLPPPMTSSVVSLASPVDSGVALIDSDFDNTSISEVTLDNDKNEDDLPFTNMEESGVIWDESIESQPHSVCNSVITQIYNENMALEYSDESLKQHPSIKGIKNDEDKLLYEKSVSPKNVKDNSDCLVNGRDEIVFRRTKGRKTRKEKEKCVSFHDDSNQSHLSSALVRSDNRRFSINESCDWFFKESSDNKLCKSNYISRNKSIPNCYTTTAVDEEIGVEVECESNSSTVTEVSLYKKCQDIIKERLGSIQSKVNKSSSDILYGSTSSLLSAGSNHGTPTRSNVKNLLHQSQKRSSMQKRHSLGNMLKSIKGQWLVPVSERGVPEGQEDPERVCSSMTNLNDKCLYTSSIELASDSEWSSETEDHAQRKITPIYRSGHKNARRSLWPSRNLRESFSKTSLVNKFLRSIPETKIKVNLALNRKRLPVYIKGVKPNEELSKQLLDELENEMKNCHFSESSFSIDIDERLHKAISVNALQNSQEIIYKVYKVSSLDGLPLLCVLSNLSMYICGINPLNQEFFNHHAIPYSQLSKIIVGPNSQVMMLAVSDRNSRVTILTTLGRHMVNDLLGHLELAVRRALKNSSIFVQELMLQDMVELKHILVKQSSVEKHEKLEHYVWVNKGDSNFTPASDPLGPTKSGHLMFKPHKHSSWLPGYILLKAGVLYVFADANQRLPNHAVPLHSGQCGGCRRVPNPIRPHTFEIILPSYGSTFQLAAADEYEVSDWLQAFVQAASGDSDSEMIHDELSEVITGCGLLLTTNHILTIGFPYKVIACAELQNLSSIKLSFNCCILETGCREVGEDSGDWVTYFATESALEEFLTKLVELLPSLSESIVMMSESDMLNIRCEQTSRLLEESWQLLLNPQVV